MKIKDRQNSVLNLYNSNEFYSFKIYNRLYNFFVTNPLVDSESFSSRTLKTYGWSCDKVEGELKKKLDSLDVFNNIIEVKNVNDVYSVCEDNNLSINNINISSEKVVVQKDNKNITIYNVLYSKIRDALSHGNYRIQKNKKDTYMFIAEDYSSQGNLNARIVVKVKTLENIVSIIDKNGLIKC